MSQEQKDAICRICPLKVLMESEAGQHFLAAKREFMLGIKALIEKDLRWMEDMARRPSEEPAKAKKIKIQ